MSAIITRLDNISFSYASEHNQVLNSLTLELQKGEITTILGPNGIGKTTLLHIILGWIKIEKGAVLHKERMLEDYSRKEMGRLIGLVPQYEHISFEYSLLEYVLLGRAPHLHSLHSPGEIDITIALDALEKVGLAEYSDKSVLHLR